MDCGSLLLLLTGALLMTSSHSEGHTAAGPITHQGSGVLYGFSADASLPPSNYSRAVKLQYYRGGGGHSAPGYELDQGAGFDRLWASAEAMIKRAHVEDAKAILVICDLWAKFDGGAGRASMSTIPRDACGCNRGSGTLSV